MAFPQATSRADNSGGNVTTYNAPIPDNLAAGDLVLLCVTKDGTGAQTWPGSPAWTQISATQTSDSHDSQLRYRHIDGTEGWSGTGNTIAITGASEGWASAAVKITGHDTGTNPSAAGTFNSAGSANPDPPAHNPTGWDVEDTLWAIFYTWDGNVSHTSYPTNYGNDQATSRWANTGGVGIATATRENAVASEDPGTATISASEEWAAFTCSVRPGAPVEALPKPPVIAPSYAVHHASNW